MNQLRPARSSRRSLSVLATMLAVVAGLLALTPSAASAAVNATVTGRVVDAAGAPVAGLRVYAGEVKVEPDFAYVREAGAAVTGADGRYRIKAKATGSSVTVCTAGDDRFVGRCFGKAVGRGDGDPYAPYLPQDKYQLPEYKGTSVAITEGAVTKNIDFRLSPPARVRGIVKNADGGVVIGQQVTVRSSSSGCAEVCREPIFHGETDLNGRYDIAITDPVDSPATYCVIVQGRPIRYGSVSDEGYYSCEKSIRTGEVVDVPTTYFPGNIVNVETPYWVGTPKVGWTISARPGKWDPADVTLSYAWFAGSRKLGTGPTYTVKAAELGQRIILRTTATAPHRYTRDVSFSRPEAVGP